MSSEPLCKAARFSGAAFCLVARFHFRTQILQGSRGEDGQGCNQGPSAITTLMACCPLLIFRVNWQPGRQDRVVPWALLSIIIPPPQLPCGWILFAVLCWG